jgi:hypothetical protein
MRALRQNYPDITFSLAPSLTGRGAAGIDRGIFAYEKRADRVEYVASVIYDEATADKLPRAARASDVAGSPSFSFRLVGYGRPVSLRKSHG